jgi:hypothetical protein
MRTSPLRIPRAFLALVALLWVGFTATPLPHHCEMATAPADAGAGHHEGHHGSSPAPGTSCHCVGHACCATAAAPATATTALPLPRTLILDEPQTAPGRLATAVPHLLPFSLAPPLPARV